MQRFDTSWPVRFQIQVTFISGFLMCCFEDLDITKHRLSNSLPPRSDIDGCDLES